MPRCRPLQRLSTHLPMLLVHLLVGSATVSALPFPAPADAEVDSEATQRILGSSVVTSVSVIMDLGNGTKAVLADPRPLSSGSDSDPLVGSPAALMNPDRYEFYTFDESGDLVRRYMTLPQIQSIIAGGDGSPGALPVASFPTRPMASAADPPAPTMLVAGQEGAPTAMGVKDVVANVQNVLRSELEANKNKSPVPGASMPTAPLADEPEDSSGSWSVLLPAILNAPSDTPSKNDTDKATTEATTPEEQASSEIPATSPSPSQSDATTEKTTTSESSSSVEPTKSSSDQSSSEESSSEDSSEEDNKPSTPSNKDDSSEEASIEDMTGETQIPNDMTLVKPSSTPSPTAQTEQKDEEEKTTLPSSKPTPLPASSETPMLLTVFEPSPEPSTETPQSKPTTQKPQPSDQTTKSTSIPSTTPTTSQPTERTPSSTENATPDLQAAPSNDQRTETPTSKLQSPTPNTEKTFAPTTEKVTRPFLGLLPPFPDPTEESPIQFDESTDEEPTTKSASEPTPTDEPPITTYRPPYTPPETKSDETPTSPIPTERNEEPTTTKPEKTTPEEKTTAQTDPPSIVMKTAPNTPEKPTTPKQSQTSPNKPEADTTMSPTENSNKIPTTQPSVPDTEKPDTTEKNMPSTEPTPTKPDEDTDKDQEQPAPTVATKTEFPPVTEPSDVSPTEETPENTEEPQSKPDMPMLNMPQELVDSLTSVLSQVAEQPTTIMDDLPMREPTDKLDFRTTMTEGTKSEDTTPIQEESTVESKQQPTEETSEQPTEKPTDNQTEKPTDNPKEEPTEKSTEQSSEDPSTEPHSTEAPSTKPPSETEPVITTNKEEETTVAQTTQGKTEIATTLASETEPEPTTSSPKSATSPETESMSQTERTTNPPEEPATESNTEEATDSSPGEDTTEHNPEESSPTEDSSNEITTQPPNTTEKESEPSITEKTPTPKEEKDELPNKEEEIEKDIEKETEDDKENDALVKRQQDTTTTQSEENTQASTQPETPNTTMLQKTDPISSTSTAFTTTTPTIPTATTTVATTTTSTTTASTTTASTTTASTTTASTTAVSTTTASTTTASTTSASTTSASPTSASPTSASTTSASTTSASTTSASTTSASTTIGTTTTTPKSSTPFKIVVQDSPIVYEDEETFNSYTANLPSSITTPTTQPSTPKNEDSTVAPKNPNEKQVYTGTDKEGTDMVNNSQEDIDPSAKKDDDSAFKTSPPKEKDDQEATTPINVTPQSSPMDEKSEPSAAPATDAYNTRYEETSLNEEPSDKPTQQMTMPNTPMENTTPANENDEPEQTDAPEKDPVITTTQKSPSVTTLPPKTQSTPSDATSASTAGPTTQSTASSMQDTSPTEPSSAEPVLPFNRQPAPTLDAVNLKDSPHAVHPTLLPLPQRPQFEAQPAPAPASPQDFGSPPSYETAPAPSQFGQSPVPSPFEPAPASAPSPFEPAPVPPPSPFEPAPAPAPSPFEPAPASAPSPFGPASAPAPSPFGPASAPAPSPFGPNPAFAPAPAFGPTGTEIETPVDLQPAPGENMGLEVTTASLGDDVRKFADLCNELAFRLWSAVTVRGLHSGRSVVMSPLGVTSILAMVFLGARGPTSGQMNDILKLDDMVTFNPHQVFRNVTESVVLGRQPGIATAAFVRQLYSDRDKGKLLDFYKERAQQFYDGHVEEVNFNGISDIVRRRTNMLVKRQTMGKVPEYLRGSHIQLHPPLAAFGANIFQTDCSAASTEGRDGEMYFTVLPGTRQRRLVLVPAAVWRSGFLAGYEPHLDCTAVALGGADSLVSVIMMMPGQQGQLAPGDGVSQLERRLTEPAFRRGAWSRVLRSLLPRPGLELQLPRFSHRSLLNLTYPLQRMGLKDLFNAERADLRGLNGVANDLHLSDIVQVNTFSTCAEGSGLGNRHHVEVYPTSGMGRSGRWDMVGIPLALRPRQAREPQPAPRLRFDRPFLYAVRHNPTGFLLHVGRFNPHLLH